LLARFDDELTVDVAADRNFPTMMDDWVIQAGKIGKRGTNSVEYHSSGFINKVAGTFQIGIDTVNNVINHRFFKP